MSNLLRPSIDVSEVRHFMSSLSRGSKLKGTRYKKEKGGRRTGVITDREDVKKV